MALRVLGVVAACERQAMYRTLSHWCSLSWMLLYMILAVVVLASRVAFFLLELAFLLLEELGLSLRHLMTLAGALAMPTWA